MTQRILIALLLSAASPISANGQHLVARIICCSQTLLRQCVVFLLVAGGVAFAVDTDGDGLLDLVDLPDFDPLHGRYANRGIEDLDGAQLIESDVLELSFNRIVSIEPGDFGGSTNLTYLSLVGNQISSIEEGDLHGLNNLQELWLIDNEIANLEESGFAGATNLTFLSLFGNQITSLEKGDFNALANLKGLDLDRNQIKTIEDGDFDGLANLTSLFLGFNQVASIESRAFRALRDLETLSLNGNKITSIERKTFEGLRHLTTLFMDGNQITTLDSGDLGGLVELTGISLGENQIKTVEPGALNGLAQLSSLNLVGNQITGIKKGAFDGLTSLTDLSLFDNQITVVESDAFAGLVNLRSFLLWNNPLTQLNLTGAEFQNLQDCGEFFGFCLDGAISDLILDSAVLSSDSFRVIAEAVNELATASLVGVQFSDSWPSELSSLLAHESLTSVTVDEGMFEVYANELNGSSITIISFGDTNKDQHVDFGDFQILANNFGQPGRWSDGDFDRDGQVGFGDFVLLASNFEREGARSVPEPSSHHVCALAALLLLACRRTQKQQKVARSQVKCSVTMVYAVELDSGSAGQERIALNRRIHSTDFETPSWLAGSHPWGCFSGLVRRSGVQHSPTPLQ